MSRFDLYFVYYSTLSSLFTQFPSILCKFIEELRKFDDVNWTYISPAGDFQTDGERTGKYILGGEDEKVTSSVLAGSIGVNPVIVRNVMGNLKEAGLISISQGKSGISLTKTPGQITFYDVYKAVDGVYADPPSAGEASPRPLPDEWQR